MDLLEEQAGDPFRPIPVPPLVGGADADAHGGGDIHRVFASIQPGYQYRSTTRGQAGILVNVHSVCLQELLFFQTTASQSWIE